MNTFRLNKSEAVSLSDFAGATCLSTSNELLHFNDHYADFSYGPKAKFPKVFKSIADKANNNINTIQLEHWVIENASIIIYPGLDGIVISEKNEILKEQIKYFRPKIFNAFLFDCIKSKHIKNHHVPEECFLGFDSSWRNYYHFLVLTLPKYYLRQKYIAEARSILPDIDNTIKGNPSIPSYSSATFNSILRMSPLEETPKFLKPGIYTFDKLHYLKIKGSDLDYVYSCNFQKFYSGFSHGDTKKYKNSNVFLSRKNRRNSRPIDSIEERIRTKFVQDGYEVICPDELTFEDQMALFNNAKQIVGLHGAAFTNILFNNNQSVEIHEFSSLIGKETTLRPHFFNLAKIKNLKYKSTYKKVAIK